MRVRLAAVVALAAVIPAACSTARHAATARVPTHTTAAGVTGTAAAPVSPTVGATAGGTPARPAGPSPGATPSARATNALRSPSGAAGPGPQPASSTAGPSAGTSGPVASGVPAPGPAQPTTAATTPPAGAPAPVPPVAALGDAVVTGPPVSGPSAAGEVVSASAGCPAGATLIGGGGYLDFAAGGSQSSMRFDGTLPSDAGGTPVAGPGAMAGTWTVRGAAGGQAMTGAQTHPFALCETSGPALTLQIRTATVAGPFSQTNQPVASATATCPSGTVLVGGGGFSTTPSSAGTNPSLHLIGTFPSAGGQPATSGSADGWTTSADAGGGALTGTTTTSYAICAGGLPATTIVASTLAGPVNGLGENRSVTAACPSGTVLLGGGGRITSTDPAGIQQGVHLRGSFPSDAGSWTAIAIDGGQTSPNHATTAFAVCSG